MNTKITALHQNFWNQLTPLLPNSNNIKTQLMSSSFELIYKKMMLTAMTENESDTAEIREIRNELENILKSEASVSERFTELLKIIDGKSQKIQTQLNYQAVEVYTAVLTSVEHLIPEEKYLSMRKTLDNF